MWARKSARFLRNFRVVRVPALLGTLVGLFVGCVSGEDDSSSLGRTEQAIFNGQRAPRVVPLSEGQTLAIGWMHFAGDPASQFCSGTLITPRVVATAKHCTQGEQAANLAFAFGVTAETVQGSIQVSAIYEHDTVDAALLLLAEDATASVPGIIPIAANRAPLDQGYVGREVEAAGYGRTQVGDGQGRFFAVVQLVDFDAEYLTVDGRGREGICFGDSGGPVLTVDANGVPVVLGVEARGAETCVDQDHLTRLDAIAAFIDSVTGAQPPAGCGAVDYLGACEGDTAVWCQDGALRRLNCGESGQVCGFVDDTQGYYCKNGGSACGDVGESGTCLGDVVVHCRGGALVQEDCAVSGRRCGLAATGALCYAPVPPSPSGPGAGGGQPPGGGLTSPPATEGGEDDDEESGGPGITGCAQTGGDAPFWAALLVGASVLRPGRRRTRRP